MNLSEYEVKKSIFMYTNYLTEYKSIRVIKFKRKVLRICDDLLNVKLKVLAEKQLGVVYLFLIYLI